MSSWEYFDHAADVGIRVRAGSLAGLFEAAARALTAWMGPEPEGGARDSLEVRVAGEDLSDLLVRWLQEVLYCFHVRRLYLTRADAIELDERHFRARIHGLHWNDEHAPAYAEVKAVTYHRLDVKEENGAWSATLILDI